LSVAEPAKNNIPYTITTPSVTISTFNGTPRVGCIIANHGENGSPPSRENAQTSREAEVITIVCPKTKHTSGNVISATAARVEPVAWERIKRIGPSGAAITESISGAENRSAVQRKNPDTVPMITELTIVRGTFLAGSEISSARWAGASYPIKLRAS
jgi:hypothetical protein